MAWVCLAGPLVAQDAVLTPASAPSIEQLRGLSIEQLGQLRVTSVSKQPQALADSPAAIYVITHNQIVRSGATTLPEILRLAPNLEVYQTSASGYVITARGFDGAAADQSFSNKLLVLIDGRSVYSPMFSGVYWDMQDVVVEDIDRIEVISGPGATLWGANAVNGVINIITRKAKDTQGGLVDVAGGNLDGAITLRYGGRAGENLDYRVYFKETIGAATELADGAKAHDSWSRPQGGFRLDWTPTGADSVTLQGDAFAAAEAQDGAPNQDIQGRNLTGRWTHAWANGQSLQVLGYYDYGQRTTQGGNGSFYVNTYDLEGQEGFALGPRDQLLVGSGIRLSQYAITNAPSLLFQPSAGTLKLFDIFAQDTFSLSRTANLVAGLKLEHDPYSGWTLLPDVRASWKPTDQTLLWAAVSRSIRSPTPFDTSVMEKIGSLTYLVGDRSFRPETLTAYQAGARAEAGSRASISLSAYYNVYDDLRSIEPNPATVIPLSWANGIAGETYGVEAWGDWQALDWWRLSPAVDAMHEHFTFRPGYFALVGAQQVANDPSYQASLTSSMSLGRFVTLDATLRWVSDLPDPRVPAYVELNARLGWNITDKLRLSVAGFNLLHARHQELPAPYANAVPRSVLAELSWRF
ncbi:MAG: TonB-dependent receptor plug domain-containing protein [Caulobacteraceae bacterium]